MRVLAGRIGDAILGPRRLLVFAVFVAINCLVATRPTDIDFWWHLRTGELIAISGAIPTTDPFSYTAGGSPWVAHEWLWELMIYWVIQIGGYRLAILLSCLVFTATYVFLYRLLRVVGLNPIGAILLVVWAVLLAVPSVGVRPREWTHLFLAVYVYALWLHRLGRVRSLWFLPLIMIVWVNVHGPFILGAILVSVFALDSLLSWRIRQTAFPAHLLIVAAATLVACCVNPRGPAMLLYPLGYYSQTSNPSFSAVTEFQSPDFHNPLYLLFAAALIAIAILGSSRARLSPGDIVLFAGFAAQALISLRHVPVFAIVSAPILGARLSAASSWLRVAHEPVQGARSAIMGLLILILLPVSVLLWFQSSSASGLLQLGNEPSTLDLPVKGASFIETNGLEGPILNDQRWGGYLIYRLYPGHLVFIDGRIDVYGDEITTDYIRMTTLKPDWSDLLCEYGVRVAILRRDSPLSLVLQMSRKWERVFQGDVEDVLVIREAQAGACEQSGH